MATICAAKHQRSNKSLKIKHKALKQLEKDPPHKDVASIFGEPMNTHLGKKKQRNTLQSYERGLGAKRVKPKKYETLNKALKKWLLNLRSENVQVNKALVKEKALEFANELNIEGFQASKGWLEK